MTTNNTDQLKRALDLSVDHAIQITGGKMADYIPELARFDANYLGASILLLDGQLITSGADPNYIFTLQSVSKLVLLIGLIEEFGASTVFSWIKVTASEQSFEAIGRLDQYGTVPSNPLINAGAIALSSRIPGNSSAERRDWVHKWIEKLFGEKLQLSEDIFNSEYQHSDRNRSIAYLMKSTGVLIGDVEEALIPYIMLCSFQLNIKQAAYLPMLLANGGINQAGKRIIDTATSNQVIAIMATCGLYNESGIYLVKTGLPAKSGVSGLIVAVAAGKAGVAVYSPPINSKGTSIRGRAVLEQLSKHLNWHFAMPN